MAAGIDVNRPLLAVAGLCGAVGVALAAAASHRGGADLGIAASFLQLHAPALLGISLLRNRIAAIGGWVLVAGLVLFAGDLAARTAWGASPFPVAAPIGGTLLILGWLMLAASAFIGWRERAPR